MAEVLVAAVRLLGHLCAHLGAVVAMEGVALDIGRLHVLAPEDVFERLLDRRRAGSRRTRDGNDGVSAGHWRFLSKQSAACEQRRVATFEQRLDAFMNEVDI